MRNSPNNFLTYFLYALLYNPGNLMTRGFNTVIIWYGVVLYMSGEEMCEIIVYQKEICTR